MIAFDSNVLIYWLLDGGKYKNAAGSVFKQISTEKGVCSTIVATEVLYGDLRSVSDIPVLHSESIKMIPVNVAVAELAGQLRLQHSIKNLDAIHLATALYANADQFVTNDKKLQDLQIPGLSICGL